jgi:mRNA interferase HigB
MILIGRKIIVEFGRDHPQSRNPLAAWEQAIKQTDYRSFHELKWTFPSVDYVNHRYAIFNIGGNKYRLIAEIDYSANVINIKRIWTHAEYSMRKNKDAINRGKL